MATIIYNPSHDVRLPDNGPVFDGATVVARVQVQNTGTAPGDVVFYLSTRRGGGVSGRPDRRTIAPGPPVTLEANYDFSGTQTHTGYAILEHGLTGGEEIGNHSFSLGISQRSAELAIVGHIEISI